MSSQDRAPIAQRENLAGLDLLVLDSEGLLPAIVDVPAAEPTSFHGEASALAAALDCQMLEPGEVTNRLLRLAGLAVAHSRAFRGSCPSADESAAVSTSALDLREAEIDERIRYDQFFGIRRVADLDANTLARGMFQIYGAVLHEVTRTQLGIHELRALLAAIVESTRWIPSVGEPAPELLIAQPLNPLRRFVLGHHVFALFANFARRHVRSIETIRCTETAEEALLSAARYARATTAAMWFSVSFPPTEYAVTVRPAMDAASSEEHGFSGADNFDFRRFRESWEHLHDNLVNSWRELAPGIRGAAQLFFETLVVDNEHHTSLAAEMVNLLPSLNGERHARRFHVHAISAVAALRLNTDDRRTMVDNLQADIDRPLPPHLVL